MFQQFQAPPHTNAEGGQFIREVGAAPFSHKGGERRTTCVLTFIRKMNKLCGFGQKPVKCGAHNKQDLV